MSRGPATRPNSDARPPRLDTTGTVRRVETAAPAEFILPDTQPPDRSDLSMLWFQGRPAVGTTEGRAALDAGGAPILFDQRLAAHRLSWRLEGREPVSLAQDGVGGYWVATRTGSVVRVAADGQVVDSAASGYAYSWVTASGEGVWAFRSPEQFAFPFGQPAPPLVTALRGTAPPVPARQPRTPLMVDLVNAGRIVPADDGGFFYAPFIRDEIVRFGPDGDTLWIASRALPHGVLEPTIALGSDGRPVLDYAPVNLGIQIGPDAMLYALATPGHTVERARLDRIDPASGIVRATVELPTALPTLAIDPDGRVYLLDAFRLLTGVAPADREPFAPFDLETLRGGRVRLADFRGKVLLVNVWASWCAPCREEMPALDALRREFADEPFAFAAISDDVRTDQARAFIDEFGFDFPVPLGRGRMRTRYHYFGLPFTVLVDADGNVVQRWSGYGGEAQIQTLRSVIRAELDRDAGRTEPGHLHGGH